MRILTPLWCNKITRSSSHDVSLLPRLRSVQYSHHLSRKVMAVTSKKFVVVCSWQLPATTNVCKTRGCNYIVELLMMSGVSLETKLETLLHSRILLVISIRFIVWCSDPWTSMSSRIVCWKAGGCNLIWWDVWSSSRYAVTFQYYQSCCRRA
jgi:hypothetical protein